MKSYTLSVKESRLVSLLRKQVKERPDDIAFSLLGKNYTVLSSITYKELYDKAGIMATFLQKEKSNIIILVFEQSIEAIVSFWACIRANKVPIPVFYSEGKNISTTLKNILLETQGSIVLSKQSIIDKIKVTGEMEQVSFFTPEEIMANNWCNSSLTSVDKKNNISCILFSSGTTDVPKGVIITEENLLHNFPRAKDIFYYSETSKILSWSPIQHVLGLTVHMFMGIYMGIPVYLLSPELFMGSPSYFLQLISFYKITHIGFPNFALKILKNASNIDCDLSSIKSIVCGGELVYNADVQDFANHFKDYGLNSSTIIPAYGLTETCGVLTGYKPKNKEYNKFETDNSVIVSNGSSGSHIKIEIRDKESGKPCKENEIGIIYISGNIVSPGYLTPVITKKLNENTILFFEEEKDRWFNSKDIGFLHREELYIIGREKDILQIRGKKYSLKEIEQIVFENITELNSFVAAISIEIDDEEKLVLLIETNSELSVKNTSLKNQIRTLIVREKGIAPYDIIFVGEHTLPRGDLGKISKKGCSDLYQKINKRKIKHNGKLGEVKTDFVTNNLMEEVQMFIKVNENVISQETGLVALGFDSLSIARFRTFLIEKYNLNYSLKSLFDERTTIKTIAAAIQKQNNTAPFSIYENIAGSKQNDFPVNLTDIQHSYWISTFSNKPLSNCLAMVYIEVSYEEGINMGKLNQAFSVLKKRHPMLSAFINSAGKTEVDEVFMNTEVFIPVYSKESFKDTRNGYEKTEFILSEAPLFKVGITKISNAKTIIHFCSSLLISDALSLQIIMRDWFLLYKDKTDRLPILKGNFPNYIKTLEEEQTKQNYLDAKDYYNKNWHTIYPAPKLPLETPLNKVIKTEFQHIEFSIDKPTSKKIKQLCKKEASTTGSLFLAAYAKVLSLWSNSDKFSINVTTQGRAYRGKHFDNVFGDFTSNMLLSVEAATSSFKDLISQIGKKISSNLEYYQFGGVEVMRLITNKTNKESVIFPIVFTNATGRIDGALQGKMYTWGTRNHSFSQTPQVLLDCQLFEEDECFMVAWDYVAGIFPDNMIKDMFESFAKTIKRMAKDLQFIHQNKIDLLPYNQKDSRILYNSTSERYQPKMLFDDFIERVKEQPNKIAVVCKGVNLSYKEIYRLSLKLSQKLKDKGVDEKDTVGIHLKKGWEQVVAVFAIQFLGGTYVDINVDFPLKRKKIIIEDSRTSVVIVNRVTKNTLSEIPKIELLDISQKNTISNTNIFNEKSIAKRFSLPAYLIYTSGSTGIPKGVLTTHKSAYNTIYDINKKFKVSYSDSILALSSLSFDLSVYDIFGVLGQGGTLIIPTEEDVKNPLSLKKLIDSHNVTIWNSVPALIEIFANYISTTQEYRTSLRLILLSGDWVSVKLPDILRKHFIPSPKIISLGGATEAAIWSIYYPINSIDSSRGSIPYGRPLANQKIFILNKNMEECPDYVIGDIYIAGDGLALGYWNNREKTDKAFIYDDNRGFRLYKTGDIGRFLPDTQVVELIGREDSQIKYRGYRIEIGEIEHALNKHKLVKRAIVSKVINKSGNEDLECFVVPSKEKQEVSIEDNCIILDKEARKKFKLALHGVRKENMKEQGHIDLIFSKKSFFNDYILRSSSRKFSKSTVSTGDISNLLSCLSVYEYNGTLKRKYASAGSSYPIQIYFHHYKEGNTEIDSNMLYYYNPLKHSLEVVSDSFIFSDFYHVSENKSIYREGAFTIFIAVDYNAIVPLYGDKSRDFSLIEVGLISQLLEQSGVASGIGLCQIGIYNNYDFISQFRFPHSNYEIMHSFIGGVFDYSFRESEESDDIEKDEILRSHNNGQTESFINILKQYLKEELPHYMIPSKWMLTDNIKLTNNGKIDRKGMQDLTVTKHGRVSESDLTINIKKENIKDSSIQVVIQETIKEILDSEASIEFSKNFFEMGFDSKTIVLMWRKIVEKTGIDYPLTVIFEYTTIKTLSSYLKSISN